MSKHQETPLGHCLGCVPVRTGVLAFACFLLLLSVCAVLGIVTEDTRVLVGGYTYWSNITVDVLGCLGIVICSMGIIGVNDNHTRWVRWFANFALLRVIARLFVLWADWNTLNTCEKFGISSLSAHYNAAMETVVLQGRCPTTRPLYLVISVVDILVSLHGLYNAYFWCYIVEHGPMYHISIDDTKPLRIYTGYSTVGHPEAPPKEAVPTAQGPDNNYYPNMAAHPMAPNMQPMYPGYLAQPQHPGYGGVQNGGVQQPGGIASLPY